MLRNKIITQNSDVTTFLVHYKGNPYRAKCDTTDFNSLPNKTVHFKDGDRKYLVVSEGKKQIYLHRLIMNAPDDMIVDHKKTNSQNNNCRSNLRVTTYSNNQANKVKKHIKELPKGINQNNAGNYTAWIQKDKRKYYLGTFPEMKKALKAYNKFGKELFGEYFLKAA